MSGKPGNVREFDSWQGNVKDFTKSQGKNLVREKLPKTVDCKLHLRPYMYSVRVYSVLNIKYMVSDYALLHWA